MKIYEQWNEHKPNLSHLKIFGCKAYVYVHKEKEQKFDKKVLKLSLLITISEARDSAFIHGG